VIKPSAEPTATFEFPIVRNYSPVAPTAILKPSDVSAFKVSSPQAAFVAPVIRFANVCIPMPVLGPFSSITIILSLVVFVNVVPSSIILAYMSVSPVVSLYNTILFNVVVAGVVICVVTSCHITVVMEVAVRTFPVVGGAARDTFIAMPMVCNAFASTKFVAPVIVLLVRVSVVFCPTRVVVFMGKVIVLVFAIELIIGAVRVLFVRV
jgi:hypothetical protein